MPNENWNPEQTTREFRVKPLRLYVVTDWKDYRDGTKGVVEVCGPSTREQANALAEALGELHPGALVNPIGPPVESYGLYGPDDILRMMPYEFAAAIRRDAATRGDAETLATLDRLQIAVDA